jgi:hypothetical protein
MFKSLFKKKKEERILLNEDIVTLREIERKAYVEEAKTLAAEKGKANAQKDFKIKVEVSQPW